ncbi:MAG: endonuclease domain-containing protein, partial [Deltaproteobacteria bacterium]|nr:endonuclease domain-containing protein [Deltaproteobacteria bacterium]
AREGGQGGERPGFPAMAGRPVRPGTSPPGPAGGPAALPGPVDLPSRRPGLFGEDGLKAASAGLGFPIEGLPHPASPIEKMLARSLELDGRLRGLFLCNQLIEARGETLMVDFYWPRGKLVVEADGYAFHRSHLAFRNDRYRDFLLTVTGRTVLRLTGYDISMDLPGSLGRIWETVKFVSRRDGLDPGRQASSPGPGPGPMGE